MSVFESGAFVSCGGRTSASRLGRQVKEKLVARGDDKVDNPVAALAPGSAAANGLIDQLLPTHT